MAEFEPDANVSEDICGGDEGWSSLLERTSEMSMGQGNGAEDGQRFRGHSQLGIRHWPERHLTLGMWQKSSSRGVV